MSSTLSHTTFWHGRTGADTLGHGHNAWSTDALKLTVSLVAGDRWGATWTRQRARATAPLSLKR